jgi:hypothetical protein
MRVAAAWTAATALGFALAGFLPRGGWVTFFAFGLVACLPQAIALLALGRFGVFWFVITSIAVPAAYLVAAIVAIVTLIGSQWMPVEWDAVKVGLTLIAASIVAGLFVGTLQSPAFGWPPSRRRVALWAGASAVGSPAASAMFIFTAQVCYFCVPPAPLPIIGLVLGGAYGFITGIALERLLSARPPN